VEVGETVSFHWQQGLKYYHIEGRIGRTNVAQVVDGSGCEAVHRMLEQDCEGHTPQLCPAVHRGREMMLTKTRMKNGRCRCVVKILVVVRRTRGRKPSRRVEA
jgi:hypothetical protein